MGISRQTALILAALLAAGCAQQNSLPKAPEQGDPNYFKVRDSMADEVYVTDDVTRRAWFNDVRRIYFAPTDTSQMQVIQPLGVAADSDDAWKFSDEEVAGLREIYLREMTRAMEADQAFHIVATPGEAQAVVHSRVIAVHPYQGRSDAQASGRVGGAITMSFALVDPSDNHVVIRAIDSKSTDDVYAFRQVDSNRGALDVIYDAWGHQLRRSLLFLQGRLDSVPTPILLKSQR